MGTLLSLIFFVSIFGIWYFWKKKPNKTYLISSIIALVLSTFLYSFTPEYKNDEKKRDQESSSSITKTTSSKTTDSKGSNALLDRAAKLKYGMSYDEVKTIMKDKPTTDERGESGTYLLQYDVDKVILNFDENDKLTAAIEGAPQIAKQAQESIKKAKKESSDNRDKLIGFAQSFGRKPVEKLQKMSMVYTSERIGDSMYYVWDTGEESVGKLVRVDDPEKFTTVYQYDENGQDGMLGKQLYSGRTIMDNPTKVYIYQ